MTPPPRRQSIAIAFVIAAGLGLGGWILSHERSAAPEGGDAQRGSDRAVAPGGSAPIKGPHGGKLFTQDGFGVEVTIFEKGVPPQFRLYLQDDARLLPPTAARVTLTVSRLGAAPLTFAFTPEADYLLGDHMVDEPHSFDVVVAAERDGKRYRWSYSQVEARVEMPDAALASTGVQIRVAGEVVIKPTVELPGQIAFNDEKTVHVVPRVPGVVVAVAADLGQNVAKGQVLAVIESPALAELRSQWLAARKRLALARTTFEREKTLWDEKITAQQDYLAAQQGLSEAEIVADLAYERLRALGVVAPDTLANGGFLSRFEVRAPISGAVVAKAVSRGETLQADTDIFTLADLSTVWAEITVYPKDLRMIRVGQRATIEATAFDAEGSGTVSHIGAIVGEDTRTARARVTLSNPAGVWKPGMFVRVELAAEAVRVPVAVAADAIQTVRDWSVVFGRYGDFFEARPLELGRTDGRMVEVIKGLSAGERYAGGNSFAVKAELGKAAATHDH